MAPQSSLAGVARVAFEASVGEATRDVHAFEPGGCSRCGGTGFRGRVGIYEVMGMTAEVRARVHQRPLDEVQQRPVVRHRLVGHTSR